MGLTFSVLPGLPDYGA